MSGYSGYGILADYKTGDPIRRATRAEWQRTMDVLFSGKAGSYTGAWADDDGRAVYVEGGPPAEAVGLEEIAQRLGVRRPTADQWRSRGVLPEPPWTVGGRPAWPWPLIEQWARDTGRLTGTS